MSMQHELEQAIREFHRGSLHTAAQLCEAVLQRDPDHPPAWHLLGSIVGRQGDLDAAIRHVNAALTLDDGFIQARYTLAELYVSADRIDEADAIYQTLTDAEPESVTPWLHWGAAMHRAGLTDEAISAYREAVSRDSSSAEAWGGLGRVFLDRGQISDAMMALKRAVKKKDDDVGLRASLALALQRLGRTQEAVTALQQSIAIDPDVAETHARLGELFLEQRRLDDAGEALVCALALDPDLARANLALGRVHEATGAPEKAAACYQRVLDSRPEDRGAWLALLLVRQALCDWDAVASLKADLLARNPDIPWPPYAAVALGLPAQTQLEMAARFAESLKTSQATPPAAVYGMRPITVAYLSGDFRDNTVGRMLASIIESHDRGRIRLAAFSYGPDDGGEVRRRVRNAVDEFVDIRHHSDEAAVREIRVRGVQILIDLGGYGPEARPRILAPRAAPLQLGMLGYRATLGAGYCDYIVVDDYLVPDGAAPNYSEQPLYLPHGLFVAEDVGETAIERADCGLPERAFVFCCFGDRRKISREIFTVWMQLLREVPHGVLWLELPDPGTLQRLHAAAQAAGVDPRRLVFSPPCDPVERSGRYALADLCLDTFPCNSASAALPALLVGCPLISCSGDSYVSRATGSILAGSGMYELICDDLQAYGRLARELAADVTRLAGIRERLRQAMTGMGLTDPRRVSSPLETAFEAMLQAGVRSDPPQPLRPVE